VTDVAGSGLQFSQPVALTLASGTGGISLNGSPVPAGSTTIDPTLYAATFHGFDVIPASVSLFASGSNATGWNVVLNFTPVPEPTTVLGVCAAGYGLACLIRRGRSRRR
jgi:hypothetical protein